MELNRLGYTIKSAKPGTSCSQKWQNLLKPYSKFNAEITKTGSGADVLDHKPPYYEEIMDIVGELNTYMMFLRSVATVRHL